MAQIDYDSYSSRPASTNQSTNKVGYFALKDNGDEAIVRFAYASPKDFDLVTVHRVQDKTTGYWRNVSCLRDVNDPVEYCPLCQKNVKLATKFFVKLIEYVQDENGTIVAVPKVWERPAVFARELKSKFDEYGYDCVFKIKRHGAKGDMQTKYDVLFANPAKYNVNDYPADFSGFQNFRLDKHSYNNKTFEEITEFLSTGVLIKPQQATANVAPATPVVTAAPVTYATPAYTPTPSTTPVPGVVQTSTPVAGTPQVTYATPTPTVAATPVVTTTSTPVGATTTVGESGPRKRNFTLHFNEVH